jgi:hypothetical protein
VKVLLKYRFDIFDRWRAAGGETVKSNQVQESENAE